MGASRTRPVNNAQTRAGAVRQTPVFNALPTKPNLPVGLKYGNVPHLLINTDKH